MVHWVSLSCRWFENRNSIPFWAHLPFVIIIIKFICVVAHTIDILHCAVHVFTLYVLTSKCDKSCENCAALFFQYSSSSCGPLVSFSLRSCWLSINTFATSLIHVETRSSNSPQNSLFVASSCTSFGLFTFKNSVFPSSNTFVFSHTCSHTRNALQNDRSPGSSWLLIRLQPISSSSSSAFG